jgi:transcriptional regulator with XRE-family HTH domain
MPIRKIKKCPVKIVLGKTIRVLRMQRNLSQEKLAELADLHTNYIGSVERGERNVSVINICKIAKGMGVPPSELLKNQEV